MNRIEQIRAEVAFYEAQINEIYPAYEIGPENIVQVEKNEHSDKSRDPTRHSQDGVNYRQD